MNRTNKKPPSERTKRASSPMSTRLKIIMIGASLAANIVAGCGMRDPHFEVIGKSQGFLSTGPVNNKVDILWVIDNSGTMGPKQQNLANSIHSFMSQFTATGLDYQIAVVTTDVRPVDPAAPNDPNRSGQGACIVGSPKILTPQTPNVETALANNAKVGFFGSAYTQGFDAVSLALSDPNLSGCNIGFLRPDAFLAVIEFSSKDEDTPTTVAQLLAFLDTVKKPVTTPSGGSLRPYFVSSMVVDNLASPNCQALGPFSEQGYKYMSASNQTGGAIASICDPDFSAGLLAVSTKILEASTAVHLVSIPDLTTVQVFENGATIPQGTTNGWTYDGTTTSIVFHGTAIPANGVYITVNYTPADIVR